MSEQQYEINSKGILEFMRKWRNVLIITCSLALVSSVVFSLLIDDKFESSVILFPTTTSSISKSVLDNQNYNESDFLAFGEEEESEQLIQLLKSDDIRNHIIEKFDLMNHYKINVEGEYRKTKLNREYESNIDFYRTKYRSVKIEVLDTDPVYASNIANEIAKMVDSVKNRMLKNRAIQAFEIVEAEYINLRKELSEIEDSLDYLRGKGVQDYKAQVEVLSDQYGAALVKNNAAAAAKIKTNLDTLSKYGGRYQALDRQHNYEQKKLSDLKKLYSEARVNAESKIEHKFIVNNAFAAEKASYPIRWLIVLVSTVATYLFTMIVLILIDPK